MLFLLSLIPSINLCSVAFSSISNNFECGFYSIIISLLRYRFNYWLILFHFLISEQESILAPLLVYGIQTLNSNWIVIILYFILFIDSLLFKDYYLYLLSFYIIDFFNFQLFIFLSSLIFYLLSLIIFSFIPFLLFFFKFYFIILILYQFLSLLLIIILYLSFIYYYLFIYLLIIP